MPNDKTVMSLPFDVQLELCLRVAVGTLLTALVGLERERSGQAAGLRTHMLVGLGAALFTALSIFGFDNGDHSRVAAQIVTGIGFLGAGAIIQRRNSKHPHGMTTAAGIWAVAAIGMACGAGLFVVGAFCAVLMTFVLAVLARVSDMINPRSNNRRTYDEYEEENNENSSGDANGESKGEIDELHRKTGGKSQQTR